MKKIIQELNLDMTARAAGFRRQWLVEQVQIITSDDADIGWMQSAREDEGLYLGQIYIDVDFQCRGIGTEIVRGLVYQATQAGLSVTLSVVKTNPARRLYERLGFHITHEDDRKFYMRREP